MHEQKKASLFGPRFGTFAEAQKWGTDLRIGATFAPTHGKIAGYHVEPSDEETPVQEFVPPFPEGAEVKVTAVHKFGNISLMNEEDGLVGYYPHVVVDVEYEEFASP